MTIATFLPKGSQGNNGIQRAGGSSDSSTSFPIPRSAGTPVEERTILANARKLAGNTLTDRKIPSRKKIKPQMLASLRNDRLFHLLDTANPSHRELLKTIAALGYKNTADAAAGKPALEFGSCKAVKLDADLRKQCRKAALFTAALRRDTINATDPVQHRIKGAIETIPSWAMTAMERDGEAYHAYPDSMQSSLSPAAYMAHLYQMATAEQSDFDYGIDRGINDSLHIDNRRPDILKTRLSNSNAYDEIPTIDIVNHVLKSGIEAAGTPDLEAELENKLFPPALPYAADVENTRFSAQALGAGSLNRLELRTRESAQPDWAGDFSFVNNVCEPLQLHSDPLDLLGRSDERALLNGNQTNPVNTWTDLHWFDNSNDPDVPVRDYINQMGIDRDTLNLLFRQYTAFDDMKPWQEKTQFPIIDPSISSNEIADLFENYDLIEIYSTSDTPVTSVEVPVETRFDGKRIYIANANSLNCQISGLSTRSSIAVTPDSEQYLQCFAGQWLRVNAHNAIPASAYGAQLFCVKSDNPNMDSGSLEILGYPNSTQEKPIISRKLRSMNYLLRLHTGTMINPTEIDWILGCKGATESDIGHLDGNQDAENLITNAGQQLLAHFIYYRDTYDLNANTFVGLVYQLNPYGYYPPLPVENTNPDFKPQIVLSQLRTLFGSAASAVREACISGAYTLSTIDETALELGDTIRAGLGITRQEWDAILNTVDNATILDEVALSRMGRLPAIAKITGESVLSLLALSERLGFSEKLLSATPINALYGVNKLVWLCNWVAENNYTPELLDETISKRKEHRNTLLNTIENSRWLTQLSRLMQQYRVTVDSLTSFTDDSDLLFAQLVTEGTLNSYGLVTDRTEEDIRVGVISAVSSVPLSDGIETSELTEMVWQLKLAQDQQTLDQVNLLSTQANEKTVRPMVIWLLSARRQGSGNIFTLTNALLKWDYDGTKYDIISAQRNSLLWDLRNRLATIARHNLTATDITLIAGQPGWLSTAVTAGKLDWSALSTLLLFKRLQSGNGTPEGWLTYLALINQAPATSTMPATSISALLASLLGCTPQDIDTWVEEDGSYPTTIEQAERFARRIDVQFELQLEAEELIPILHCAEDNSDSTIAFTALQDAITRSKASSPAELYRQNASERQRDALVALYMRNVVADNSDLAAMVTNTESLYRYLLLDVNVTSQVPTSVIVEANSSLQLYIYRALTGVENAGFLARDVLKENWAYDKEYQLWKANELLALYPSNYIEPEMRVETSAPFQTLASNLMGSGLNDDAIDSAIYGYTEDTLDEVEIRIISHCKGTDSDANTDVYHFIGHSTTGSDEYYYRKVSVEKGALPSEPTDLEHWLKALHWSFWKKIDIPVTDELNSDIVIHSFENRLYFSWMEISEDQNPIQSESSDSKSIWYRSAYYARMDSGLQVNAPIQISDPEKYFGVGVESDSCPGKVTSLQSSDIINESIAVFVESRTDDSGDLSITISEQGAEISIPGSYTENERTKFYVKVEDYVTQRPMTDWRYEQTDYKPIILDSDFKSTAAYNRVPSSSTASLVTTSNGLFVETYIKEYKQPPETDLDLFLVVPKNIRFESTAEIVSSNPDQAPSFDFWYTPFMGASDILSYANPDGKLGIAVNYTIAGSAPVDCNFYYTLPPTKKLDGESTLTSLDTGVLVNDDNYVANNLPVSNVTSTIPVAIEVTFFVRLEATKAVFEPYTQSKTGTTSFSDTLNYQLDIPGNFPPISYITEGENQTESFFLCRNTKIHQYQCMMNYSTALKKVLQQAPLPNGAEGLMSMANQRKSEGNVSKFWGDLTGPNATDLEPLLDTTVPPNDTFDFDGAYGQYGWELYYHIPALVASICSDNSDYELAVKWFTQIYNPLAKDAEKWGVKPIKDADTATFAGSGSGFNNPDELASRNPIYYGYATIRQFIEMMIKAGDEAYETETQESLQKAKMIYTEALGLLNKEQPDDAFSIADALWSEPTLETALTSEQTSSRFLPPINEEAYALMSTLHKRVENLRAWKSKDGKPLNVQLYAPEINPRALQAAQIASTSSSEIDDKALAELYIRYEDLSSYAAREIDKLKSLALRVSEAMAALDDQESARFLQQLEVEAYDPALNTSTPLIVQEYRIEAAQAEAAAAQASLASTTSDLMVSMMESSGLVTEVFTGLKAARHTRKARADQRQAKRKVFRTTIRGRARGGKDHIGPHIVGSTGIIVDMIAEGWKQESKEQRRTSTKDALKAVPELASATSQVASAAESFKQAKKSLRAEKEEYMVIEMAAATESTILASLSDVRLSEDYYTGYLAEMAAIYKSAYHSAVQACQIAESAFTDRASQFIFPVWNEATFGLSAPYQLDLGLTNMDLAHQQEKQRDTIEQQLSIQLSDLAGKKEARSALGDLRKTGHCCFSLTQEWFDSYDAAQHSRQIEAIKVTMVGLDEWQHNFRLQLVQDNHQQGRKGGKPISRVHRNNRLMICQPVTDSSEVETASERQPPFQGTGAVSEWTLSVPALCHRNQADSKAAKVVRKSMKRMLRKHLKDIRVEVVYSAMTR